MRKANVALFAMGLVLLSAPAFASNEAPFDFHALSEVAADSSAPTMLSDEQLASVEGGFHITDARSYLNAAAFFQDPAGGNNLAIAGLMQNLAIAVLFFNDPHVSGGGWTLPLF